ncbi:MAG: hypothetical protein LBH59_05620 [Planctomycetaceae bacterium]|nr:hypothetical protein [Planctomycetaceae bacterium]
MNKRSTLLRLPCSALRILKRLQHNEYFLGRDFRKVLEVLFVFCGSG